MAEGGRDGGEEAEEGVHDDDGDDEGAALRGGEKGDHGDDEWAAKIGHSHWPKQPPSWPPTSSSCAIHTFRHRGCIAAPQTQCPCVSHRWHRSTPCRDRSYPYLAHGISTLNI